MSTIVWVHVNLVANDAGIAWGTVGTNGHHAISGGGFAEAATTSNATDTTEIGANGPGTSGLVPVAAMYPAPSGLDTTYWTVGFAYPPGGVIRAHLVAVLED